jgi:hypothetical protein
VETAFQHEHLSAVLKDHLSRYDEYHLLSSGSLPTDFGLEWKIAGDDIFRQRRN